jgi:hypothetical protein
MYRLVDRVAGWKGTRTFRTVAEAREMARCFGGCEIERVGTEPAAKKKVTEGGVFFLPVSRQCI